VRQTLIAQWREPKTPPILRIGLGVVLGGHRYISLSEARLGLHDIGQKLPETAIATQLAEISLLLQLGELEEAGVMLAPFMKPGAMIEDAVPLIVEHLMERGQWQDAVRLLEDAAETFPDQRRYLQEISADILIKHDARRGLASLEVLAAEAPLSVNLSVARANALGALKRYDEAVATMQEALKDKQIDAEDRTTGLLVLGRWQVAAGRTEDAISSYRQSVDLDPKEVTGLIALSILLEKTKRWSEAYSTLRDAIALEPEKLNAFEERLQHLRNLASNDQASQ
jgi:tetratricopeptide (TPR) repeat protein